MRDWAVVVALGSATLLAYLEKWPLQTLIQGHGGGVARTLASVADACGSGFAVTSLGIAMLVAGLLARKPALVEVAVALGIAGVWCWLLMRVGQIVLAEQRPVDGGAMRFFALDGHGVSGHAAAAALLLYPARDVLARDAAPRTRRAVGLVAIAWALFIGWSRVWLGMHFAWNVMLGLALGAFAGRAAARTFER